MMSLKDNIERYKSKKELLKELEFYKSMVLKKFEEQSYKSALEKVRSALILIEEYKEDFNLEIELKEFEDINQRISDELNQYREVYVRRYENLLKEGLSESNLESFIKLLAMLKEEVDKNLDKYNLYDLRDNINNYFNFIKKLYVILSTYEVLNFQDASNKILTFGTEIKNENFPNLKTLILVIFQKLLNNQLIELSKYYNKITLNDLSERLAIKPAHLLDFIKLIIEQPNSPIKNYNPKTQEIILKT
ncbi:MAG: hypothetical protein ACFE85_18105 [Candidatus Hodarchaeota archaeon]